MSDEKKIGGKLTEQQLALDLEQLEKRTATERRGPRTQKRKAPAKKPAAEAAAAPKKAQPKIRRP